MVSVISYHQHLCTQRSVHREEERYTFLTVTDPHLGVLFILSARARNIKHQQNHPPCQRPSRRLITTISLLGGRIVPTKSLSCIPQNKSHSVPNVLMVNRGDSGRLGIIIRTEMLPFQRPFYFWTTNPGRWKTIRHLLTFKGSRGPIIKICQSFPDSRLRVTGFSG
ncbi:hypothetical protein CEXT_660411 [Caerostris extrusa]|uniref:Uncharacterized protein n=1 Tax=Caerostris extrusa TaxID=172846 RepID=A0AAV4RW87_CAEEX|nr:hypothetical protein CEXT_660411 [Caerostris extrusa]